MTIRRLHFSRRHLATLVAVLMVIAAIPAASIAWPVAAASPASATFNPNLLLQGSASAAEPSIRTDSHGQSFVIGPTGVPGGCKAFRVSHDGSTSTYLGQPDHTAGGGDCDWAIGPQETAATISPAATDDALAYSSLTLPNITVGKSDDGGKTFGPPNAASTQVVGDDRMWMAADPKLNAAGFADIFMTYHDVSVGDIQMSISVDGGQTYVQSTPIINANDVPAGQWSAAGDGNELGNIVARRPSGGALTLYSIFATPDSATDGINQSQAGTTNFNRLYEAVGTVSDLTTPPTISWRNYEIYHGPAGARYNRIFPITAVDAAGNVYAIWTDGNHVFVKADATGTGWNPSAAPVQLANPTGVNTTVMPWAQAGANGIVDVVFYGASGGAGAQPNPQDDPNNVWNVYMAQTVDGGATWGVFQASDHNIHRGPICLDGLNCNLVGNRDRTLADFFQVAIDPTNGAADIAYADDHAAPGNAVLYYTRQCTGTSATTGAALVNDCVVPPPPPPLPQGSTCPGPQVVDFTGDAPNNYPAGDGANMDNLDIVNASFGTPDSSNLQVTLTIENLSAPPPPANIISAYWTVYWTYNGTIYYAQATSTGPAVFNYSDGTFAGGTFNPVNSSLTGIATTGPNGTYVITVPRADVGNPANGATLSSPYADTHGSFTVAGTGVFYTAAADRAPDAGNGAQYVVAQTCPTTPPPACHQNDGNGQMHGKAGGYASFQQDDDNCDEQAGTDSGAGDDTQAGGAAQYQDPGTGTNFQATHIVSTTFTSTGAAHSVTLAGTGTDNGKPVTFTIVVVNNGSIGLDTYSITLSDGYSNSGNLISGSLSL